MKMHGYVLLTGLVFGSIFFVVLGALASFVITENKIQRAESTQAIALHIAEAGLEYYRWFLAHYPNDLQNGTGQPGPYAVPFIDPEGSQLGTSTLTVTGNTSCGVVTSIDVTSVGTASGTPPYSRTLQARYARPTVGKFSYILNENVWAGSDRIILGPYHSNGGIRMDGTANSEVTSSLLSWNCTSSYGCSPSSSSAPGVVGSGPNQTLWKWPEPQVNFAGIAADFGALKTLASTSGRYFATNGSASQSRGYRVIFNSNGTVSVRPVSSTVNVQSVPVENYSSGDLYQDYTIPSGHSAATTTYTLPESCGLLYFQDDIWVYGTTTRKITLVAADTQNSGHTPDINIVSNLKYSTYDGSVGLLAIAEGDVHVSGNSPYNMTLNGIFIAQTGAFGRNLYKNSSGGSCQSSYENRGTLTILGTTVSNLRTGTKWPNACGSYGGYNVRIDSFDRRLANDPPPFTPATSNDYYYVDWREL